MDHRWELVSKVESKMGCLQYHENARIHLDPKGIYGDLPGTYRSPNSLLLEWA